MATAHPEQAAEYFQSLQEIITRTLEEFDGRASFRTDLWERPGGGGGRTAILTDGRVFEKAGVNFSRVHGQLAEEFARQMPGEGLDFSATGVSLVLHPVNPRVPAVHANFRFLTKGERKWFGGGADLTPYYPRREDVVHFHQTWKAVCDRHPAVADYRRFKQWCDRYFFLPHRDEARGVGGIFFDYLEAAWEETFAFVRDAGDAFVGAYLPIARRRQEDAFGPQERAFQEFRRGRYVEFNLLYDRGTVFGLKTGGRTESILMSLPPVARWEYDHRVKPGSAEAALAEYLKPRDWLGEQGTDADTPGTGKLR